MYVDFACIRRLSKLPLSGKSEFLVKVAGRGFPPGNPLGKVPDGKFHGSARSGFRIVLLLFQGAAPPLPKNVHKAGSSLKIPYAARITIKPSPLGSHASPNRGAKWSQRSNMYFPAGGAPASPVRKSASGSPVFAWPLNVKVGLAVTLEVASKFRWL